MVQMVLPILLLLPEVFMCLLLVQTVPEGQVVLAVAVAAAAQVILTSSMLQVMVAVAAAAPVAAAKRVPVVPVEVQVLLFFAQLLPLELILQI
jgi:hypothetical protein